jgi:hypothetical protein
VRFRLNARPEDGENRRVLAGKRISSCGGRASRPDLGDWLGVGDAADGARRSVVDHNDPLVPTASGPVGIAEYADQLGAENRESGKLARHGAEHFRLADRENLPQRLRPLAARQRGHRPAHGIDAAGIIEPLLHLRGIVNGDRHRAQFRQSGT